MRMKTTRRGRMHNTEVYDRLVKAAALGDIAPDEAARQTRLMLDHQRPAVDDWMTERAALGVNLRDDKYKPAA